jgi:hypothetical protein
MNDELTWEDRLLAVADVVSAALYGAAVVVGFVLLAAVVAGACLLSVSIAP